MKITAFLFCFFLFNLCLSQENSNRNIYSMSKENAVIKIQDTIKTQDSALNYNKRIQLSIYKNILPEEQNIEIKTNKSIESPPNTNQYRKKKQKYSISKNINY